MVAVVVGVKAVAKVVVDLVVCPPAPLVAERVVPEPLAKSVRQKSDKRWRNYYLEPHTLD